MHKIEKIHEHEYLLGVSSAAGPRWGLPSQDFRLPRPGWISKDATLRNVYKSERNFFDKSNQVKVASDLDRLTTVRDVHNREIRNAFIMRTNLYIMYMRR